MDEQRESLERMKTLVAAVLVRAGEDLQLGRHLAADAVEWLTEREPARSWSFEWCCAILDLDADAVREQLVGMPACRTLRRGGKLVQCLRR
jgi:hypothetical protein